MTARPIRGEGEPAPSDKPAEEAAPDAAAEAEAWLAKLRAAQEEEKVKAAPAVPVSKAPPPIKPIRMGNYVAPPPKPSPWSAPPPAPPLGSVPAQAPRDWVPLAHVPGWVLHLYGQDDPELLARLTIAARSPHLFLPRIPNVEPRSYNLPAGLALSREYGESRVYVANWDEATKECPPGEVNGWDGQRQPILLMWAHVERWLPQYRAEARTRQRERDKAAAAASEAAVTLLPPASVAIFWTLPQVLAWVRTHDLARVLNYDPLDVGWNKIAGECSFDLSIGFSPDAPKPPEIWKLIHRALADNSIVACDRDGNPILAAFWAQIRFVDAGKNLRARAATIKSADARRLWPGAGAALAPEPAEEAETDAPAPADLKPKPADAAVRKWMRERVANWPDNMAAPNEAEDFQAVTAHFAPGLSRDEFRIVRNAETPAEWRKQGPRPPWGSARKSADNLPIRGPQK